MLVLGRSEGQRILIDGGIVITVCRITSNQVKIGVTAPKNVRVDRAEVAGKRGTILSYCQRCRCERLSIEYYRESGLACHWTGKRLCDECRDAVDNGAF